MRALVVFPAIAVALSVQLALADTHTLQECLEGGEFIRNAALARNAGMTRQQFLDRLAGDLVMIRNFAVEMRWFARDEAGENLLTSHARQVFDQPVAPGVHEAVFVESCMRPE